MAVSHVFSNAIPDGADPTIVRPSDWNSVHNQFSTFGGNTLGASSWSGTNLVLAGTNNISLSLAGNTLSISGPDLTQFLTTAALSNHSHGASAANGSFGFQTLSFSNANGVSFGTSAGSAITASHNAITTARASNDAIGLATAQSNVTWTVNSAGLSLDARGYAGTGTTFNGASLSGSMTVNSNGVELSLSAGAYLTTAMLSNVATISNIRVSGGTTSNLLSAITFGDANGVSFGLNAGTMTASIATSLTNIRVSAGTTSNLLSAVTFADGNGLSFGLNAGTITGSYTRPVVSNAIASVASATNSGTNTSRFAADDHVHAGVFSVGVSTGGNTAGDTRVDVGRFVLAGGANITLSQATAANALNTISIVGATAAPSPVNFSAGTTSNNLGSVVFSNSNGVSFGLNGSTITGSVAAGGATLSGFDPYANRMLIAIAGGQASLWINDLVLPAAVQFDRVGLRITHANTSNSSGSATISAWIGIYTRNASSLSSLHSTSFTTAITQSGTVGSYSNYGGVKVLPIPWTTTITAGNYWIGIVTRTTTGGANMTFGNMGLSIANSTASGYFGSGSNSTAALRVGAPGVYSATTAGMPAAISLTQINGNSSAFHRQPAYLFMSNIF